jgi:serine/threonine protein kinase/TPR repeat protein
MSVGVPIGTVLGGDYKIVRKLGEGGMGAVYVAEQLSTGSQRALKLMQAGLLEDAEMRRRFEQEARVGAKIKSDHVVQVIAAGVDPTTSLPYLAMELLEGHTLADALEKGPLPPHEVREVMGQLLHAMAAAHVEGVVHRDLKPENVYLAYSRREGARYTVKVLDFGIAKVVAEAKPSATRAIGTPLWMAPEQSKHGEQVVPATDVWALGLIAFRMLTGRYFWKGAYDANAETWTVMREVLVDSLPSATARAQEYGVAHLLPPGFDVWFGRAVAREPGWRFPNAAEARAALLPILDAVSQGRAPLPSYAGSYAAPQAQPSNPTPQTPPQTPGYAQPQTPPHTPAQTPAHAQPHTPAQTPPHAQPHTPAQHAQAQAMPQFGPGIGVAPRAYKKPSTVAPWLIGCGTIVVLGGLALAAFFGLGIYLAQTQSACADGDLESCETACFGMSNDGPSCGRLGDAHVKEWATPTRADDASRAYQKGCEIGHAASCRHLVALDGTKAVAALDKACSGEHSEVCGLLADALADAPRVVHDEARAVNVAKPACDKGDADACAALGRLVLRGADGPSDPKRAADLAMQACHLEQPAACLEAAVAKSAGYGTPKDDDGAKGLFLKAEHAFDARCNGGEGDACWSLGRMYGLGIGVTADADRAAHAFVRGCDAGDAHACEAAGAAALDESGPGAGDRAKARSWLEHACDSGWSGACLKAASLCESENGACAPKWESARKGATAGCDARIASECAVLAQAAMLKKAAGVDVVASLEKACELGNGPACARAVDEGKDTLGPTRTKKALVRGCGLGAADACEALADLLHDARDPTTADVRAVACARGSDSACAAK